MTPIKLTPEQKAKVKAARGSRHLAYVSKGLDIAFAKMKNGGGKKKAKRK